jgi:uncharacterized protein (TIGR00255 family)
MIRSMTGFGTAETELGGQRLSAQVQSVNHRFAEVSVRLPRSLAPFENPLRQLLAQLLTRGKINFVASWEGGEDPARRVRIDAERARQYVEELRALRIQLGIAGEIELSTLLALPDVVSTAVLSDGEEQTWEVIEKLARAAAADLLSMRTREGDALKQEFVLRLQQVEKLLGRAEARAPLRPAEAKEKLEARLRPLLGDIPVDPARLAQEIAFLAERLDCTEECVRLRAHIGQYRALLDDPEPTGRKLNFLLQEMNREANTMGSKANDAELAALVIDLKDELEKLREQVQNVE